MRVLLLYQDPRIARLLGPHLPEFRLSSQPLSGPWDLVIRWGNGDGDDPHARLLNPAGAVRMQRDRDAIAAICAVNAIPASLTLQGPPFGRVRPRHSAVHYRVDLFDLATVAVYRWDGTRYRHFPWRGSSRVASIRQLARRALYAAGLHFGAVLVGNAGGRLRVLGIDPGPALSPALAKGYASALRTYAQRLPGGPVTGQPSSPLPLGDPPPPDRDVVLGCDPEFVLRRRRTGRLVPASRFFPRAGQVGLDRVVLRVKGVPHHPIAELRPAPSPSPYELLEGLRRAMLRAAWAVRGRGIRFEAGTMGARGYPIGGHIHFSNVRPTTDLLRALDNYLTIPLFLLEDPAAARARRPRYGTLGDFRMQRHGGFEYRTAPSWIFSPEFSLAVLCLAKVIATDFARLPRNVLAGSAEQTDFYRGRKERFRHAFPDLWRDIEATASYRRYGADMEVLRRLVERQRQLHERADIKVRWLRPTGGEF